MNIFNVILIGLAPGNKKNISFDSDKIDKIRDWLLTNGTTLKIFCVDIAYPKEIEADIKGLTFHSENIENFHEKFVEEITEFQPSSISNISQNKEVDIRDTTYPVVIIDCRNVKSIYETMESFNSYNTYNRLFIIHKNGEINLDIYINRYASGERSYCLYSGAKLPDSNNVDVFERFKLAIIILKEWLYANFHKTKDVQISSSAPYSMNMENEFIKGMINYYSLQFANPDKDVNAEFGTNPAYRRLLCDILIRICSNFAKNNGLITNNQVIEMGKSLVWYSPEVWVLSLKSINKLIK